MYSHQHLTNVELYSALSKATDEVRQMRPIFGGHCCTSSDEMPSRTTLWQTVHGRTSRGRLAFTCADCLKEDVGLEPEELPTAMRDRGVWKKRWLYV